MLDIFWTLLSFSFIYMLIKDIMHFKVINMHTKIRRMAIEKVTHIQEITKEKVDSQLHLKGEEALNQLIELDNEISTHDAFYKRLRIITMGYWLSCFVVHFVFKYWILPLSVMLTITAAQVLMVILLTIYSKRLYKFSPSKFTNTKTPKNEISQT